MTFSPSSPAMHSRFRALTLVGLTLAALFSGCIDPAPINQPGWTNPFLEQGSTIRVQIDHAPGRNPSKLALDGLAQIMQGAGTRPVFNVQQTIEPTDGNYTPDEILRLHLNLYSGSPTTWRLDGEPVLHVLYLDGLTPPTEEGQLIRGLAFLTGGFPLMAIFADEMSTTSLYGASLSLPGQSNATFERSILVHEFGHMLGLVGCGTPEAQPHAHADSPCHSASMASVMYPSVHTSEDPLTWALDDEMQPVWRFDADDWTDIHAYQRALRDANATTQAS